MTEVEFTDRHIIIPLDIKKAGEGIAHNGLKQTLYRHINNAKQGKYRMLQRLRWNRFSA